MKLQRTLFNWRWWVALPLVVVVSPVLLIDVAFEHVIGPAWRHFYNGLAALYRPVPKWVHSKDRTSREGGGNG